MPNLKSNTREIFIKRQYADLGFNCLSKGYPDFCFYNDNEVIFVEVKPDTYKKSKNRGLSNQQKEMINIFKRLGLNVKVEYVSEKPLYITPPGNKLSHSSMMPFGKHKGLRMDKVPAQYLIWLHDQGMQAGNVKDYIENNRYEIDERFIKETTISE
jgi:uncharacterized protein (DUF3820 family)